MPQIGFNVSILVLVNRYYFSGLIYQENLQLQASGGLTWSQWPSTMSLNFHYRLKKCGFYWRALFDINVNSFIFWFFSFLFGASSFMSVLTLRPPTLCSVLHPLASARWFPSAYQNISALRDFQTFFEKKTSEDNSEDSLVSRRFSI